MWTLGPKTGVARSCSWPQVETVKCPAGQHKRGPLGPQFVAKESSDNCVGPGVMYIMYIENNTSKNEYI